MASLFRPNISTYQLPDGKHRTPDGKRVTKNTPGAVKVTKRSKVFYGRYRNAKGDTITAPLCGNKTAAQQILAKLVTDAAKAENNLADPDLDEHRRTPLADHLEAFRQHLEASGNCAEHVERTLARCRTIVTACRFLSVSDIKADSVENHLLELRRDPRRPDLPVGKEWFTKRELIVAMGGNGIKMTTLYRAVRRESLEAKGQGKARRYARATVEALQDIFCRGIGIQTSNHYLTAIKGFTRWLDLKGRIGKDPLKGLKRLNEKTDIRHERRALSVEELLSLLAAASRSEEVILDLLGPDRSMLYTVAMATGFRAAELASLLPRSFDLNDGPTARCRAAYTKNREEATQPLPPDVAEALRGYLAGKPAHLPVWPGSWAQNAAEMLRFDLEAAGIPYRDDDGRVVDFHALRHTYITLLDQPGISKKSHQELARHSTYKLTERYAHATLHDKTAAVERLPTMLPTGPKALAATGTEDARPRDGEAHRLMAFAPRPN